MMENFWRVLKISATWLIDPLLKVVISLGYLVNDNDSLNQVKGDFCQRMRSGNVCLCPFLKQWQGGYKVSC